MKALAGKRVLLIVENEAVPFDRRMWNMSRALRDFGADVTVICPMFGPDSARREVMDGISVLRYRGRFSDGSVSGYVKEYATAFVKTVYLLHRLTVAGGRFDIIHAANPPDIFWPVAFCTRLFGTKFVFDEHDLSPETYLSRFGKSGRRGVIYTILQCFQRLSYRSAHVILSTNLSYRDVALRVDPAYSEKTFVVRNGPDTRRFTRRAPRSELRAGYQHLAAYIGVMAVQDGVEYILRAVHHLVHHLDFADLIVYLIGDGDDRPRLQQLALDLGICSHVVFTGRIPDGPALEILSTADVFLSPDPVNPLNDVSTMTKMMEYMALGRPIVSFGLKEAMFSARESALYVRNNDVAAFAEGIREILGDPVRAQQMAAVGTARVESELSWQKQSEVLLAAYLSVSARPTEAPTDEDLRVPATPATGS